jgi:putative inorganic carbon (hco3(-)) transporter
MAGSKSYIFKNTFQYAYKKRIAPYLWLITLSILSVGFVVASAKIGLLFSLVLTIFLLGLTFVLLCIVNPKLGFIATFALPFIGFELQRLFKAEIPVGLAVQIMFFLLLLILLIKRKIESSYSFSFLSTPITYIIIVTQLYLVIQAFNPEMHSMQGWLIILRGAVAIMIVYFVSLVITDEEKFIKSFFFAWIFFSTLSAIYACYQEWYKIPDYVLNWIHATEERYRLIHVVGRYRKFSVLSDPSAFGNFMAITALATIILAFKPTTSLKRLLLIICTTFLLLAMGYSGTRTSYAMFLAGLILYILMTINNKRTLLFAVASSLIFAILIFGPIYGNATINRIRSTFNSEDKSLNVRDTNRESIQGYIYEHPIGGGVMTTGDAGMKYNPDHRLAGFPPDSGLLKTALELGWIGLILELLLYVIALTICIRNFYQSKHNKIKYYYLVICTMLFSVAVGSYAQSIQTQIPLMLVFFPSLAFITRLKEKENNATDTVTT